MDKSTEEAIVTAIKNSANVIVESLRPYLAKEPPAEFYVELEKKVANAARTQLHATTGMQMKPSGGF